MTIEEQRRFDTLVESLRHRLRHVCDQWPDPLFDEMIRHLARITVKYKMEEGPRIYDRRGTDRLVADMKELLAKNQRVRGDGTSQDRA